MEKTTTITRHQNVISGLLVSWLENGASLNNNSPAIFILPGWRQDADVWRPILSLLANHKLTAYVVDLPGFGQSETPPPSFTVSDYARLVSSLISKISSSQQVFILGHSFGGRVAIKLSAGNMLPGKLSGLILANSAGPKMLSFRQKTFKALASVFRPFLTFPLLKRLRPRFYRLFVGGDDYLATPHLQTVFQSVISEDLTPDLKNIRHPSLIIWGDQDKITPISMARLLSSSILNSELLIIKNAGHFSFQDNPKTFTAAIFSWLDKLPPNKN